MRRELGVAARDLGRSGGSPICGQGISVFLESHLKQFSDISLGINKSQRAQIDTVSHVVNLLLPISCLLFNMALMVFPSKIGYGLSELITLSGACRLRDVIFFGGGGGKGKSKHLWYLYLSFVFCKRISAAKGNLAECGFSISH